MAYTSQDIHSGTQNAGLSTKNAQDLKTALDNIDTAVDDLDDLTTAAGTITDLTDNSGGTPADTVAVIGAVYSQTEVANAVASLAAKINELIAAFTP